MTENGGEIANSHQKKESQIYLGYRYNNVSVISKMEELGLLNVDKCEEFLNKL
jgi:hypothetical protein